MKKVLFPLAVVILTACCAENKKEPTNISVDYTYTGSSTFKMIMIDSCEYIIGYKKMAHKGKCKFCAERRKREMQSIVEQINK